MKYKLIPLVIVLFSLFAHGQQRVGNGGGAELLILKMTPALKLWNKFCAENLSLCWENSETAGSMTRSLATALDKIRLEQLSFSDDSHFSPVCDDRSLTLRRADFYQNPQTAKSPPEIALALINSILSCQRMPVNAKILPPQILPLGKILQDSELMIIHYQNRSGLVSTLAGQNANQLLSSEVGCMDFLITSHFQNILQVTCLDSGVKFRVTIVRKDPLIFFAVLE